MNIWALLRDTFTSWQHDNAPRIAAALTYYTLFSVAPVLIVVVAIAGAILGAKVAQSDIDSQIQQYFGSGAARLIRELLQSAMHPRSGVIATVIGIFTMVVGASGLFSELRSALNMIWGIRVEPSSGLAASMKDLLKNRMLAFLMVLVTGVLLLASIILATALSAYSDVISSQSSSFGYYALRIVTFVASFAVTTVAFGIIYKVLPDAIVSWGDVWIGAAVTSLLFNVGRLVLGLYLGSSTVGTAYRAASSLVALLLWINYSAQIFLFGAVFTRVYSNKHGSHITPGRRAATPPH